MVPTNHLLHPSLRAATSSSLGSDHSLSDQIHGSGAPALKYLPAPPRAPSGRAEEPYLRLCPSVLSPKSDGAPSLHLPASCPFLQPAHSPSWAPQSQRPRQPSAENCSFCRLGSPPSVGNSFLILAGFGQIQPRGMEDPCEHSAPCASHSTCCAVLLIMAAAPAPPGGVRRWGRAGRTLTFSRRV